MIAAIKAELRKVFTVRSTYGVILICLGLEALASGYGGGFNAPAAQLRDPMHLATEITSAVGFLSVLVALIGILLVTHEYRYNTITYTLTSARGRGRVLAAKFIVVSLIALLLTTIFGVLSPLFSVIGAQLGGHHMVHQTMPSAALLARLLFMGWAYSMLALVISLIARVQVAALAAYFLIPGMVEQLLAVILKKKQAYLPFTSVDGVVNHHTISYGTSAVVASIWIVGGLIVAWVLFVRRDSN